MPGRRARSLHVAANRQSGANRRRLVCRPFQAVANATRLSTHPVAYVVTAGPPGVLARFYGHVSRVTRDTETQKTIRYNGVVLKNTPPRVNPYVLNRWICAYSGVYVLRMRNRTHWYHVISRRTVISCDMTMLGVWYNLRRLWER